MSDPGRSRRRTTQPHSYKEFNEKGRDGIPESPLVTDHSDLVRSSMTEEGRHSSTEVSPQDEVRMQTQTQAKVDYTHSSEDDLDVGQHDRRHDRSSASSAKSGSKNMNRKRTMLQQSNDTEDMRSSDTDQEVVLHINPQEDEFQTEEGKSKFNTGSMRQLSPNKRIRSVTKSVQKLNTDQSCSSSSATPARKTKQTVAKRLDMQNTPSNDSQAQFELHATHSLVLENQRVEREMQAAAQRLKETQVAAQNAKKRLQVEEARRKTLMLQKQLEKDNKRAEQEKIRYEREIAKQAKSTRTQASNNTIKNTNTQHSSDPIDSRISNAKNKAKNLNPLCRARENFAGPDGHNNPNIQGEDNGHNAWMDVQLNPDEVDEDLKYDARYAKRNSDLNKFYDIDDIPIRGPPLIEGLDSDASVGDIADSAARLTDENTLYTCRRTGIMRSRSRDQNRRRPTSTVSVPPERRNARDHAHQPRSSDRRSDYRSSTANQWDTECDDDSDINDKGIELIDSEFNEFHSREIDHFRPVNRYRDESHVSQGHRSDRSYPYRDRADRYRSDRDRWEQDHNDDDRHGGHTSR